MCGQRGSPGEESWRSNDRRRGDRREFVRRSAWSVNLTQALPAAAPNWNDEVRVAGAMFGWPDAFPRG